MIQVDDVERPATPAEQAMIDEIRSGTPPFPPAA